MSNGPGLESLVDRMNSLLSLNIADFFLVWYLEAREHGT